MKITGWDERLKEIWVTRTDKDCKRFDSMKYLYVISKYYNSAYENDEKKGSQQGTWGTPEVALKGPEVAFMNLTIKDLSLNYEWNHASKLPQTPYPFILASR